MNATRLLMIGLIALSACAGRALADETANTAGDPAKALANEEMKTDAGKQAGEALANEEAKPSDSTAKDSAATPAAQETKTEAPSKDSGGPLVDAVKAEIKNKSKTSGTLDIYDDKTQKVRTLDTIGLKQSGNDTVTGDFRDTKSGDVVTVEVKVTDNKVGDFKITNAQPPKPVKEAKKDYTDQELQDFMKDYISTQAAGTGTFQLYDEKSKKMRNLQFVKLQEKVRRYGIIGISTAEFKEKDTGNTVLADVNVENGKEGLNVTAVRIKNEVNGMGSGSAAAPAGGAEASAAAPAVAPAAK
jgi:hypothetical protein